MPALRGTPELDALRVALFMAVKGEPTLFVRPPEYEPATDVAVIAYRRWFRESQYPGGVAVDLTTRLTDRPDVVRAVFLREGYLYAEDLARADALVRYVHPEMLFAGPEIWIQRGERVVHAARDPRKRRYVYSDGPLVGRQVSLVLFDRAGEGAVPGSIHRDVRELAYRLGFHRLRVRHLTADRVVADLEYGKWWVPTLLEARGARLERVCEVLEPGTRKDVERARAVAVAQRRAFRPVQRAIAAQIDDALPFDEPLEEVGQEDGKLRPRWIQAYGRGRLRYEHREDEYPVFTAAGRPRVPEVCVDFLLDSIERAGGTWWRPRGEPRERVVGRVDFDRFDREALRRAPDFIEFARAHPEWFELLEIPEEQRIILGHPQDFTRYLTEHTGEFLVGDMLFLGGRVPWDERPYVHYHSFFVYESDPMTGMPLLIAGNPGAPSLRTWKIEMRRTPLRALRARVRAKPDWLASVVVPETDAEIEPPPLTYGP